jgi:serine/threonine protein kinase
VFVRKGDSAPLVLFHGSFYKNVTDKSSLFAGAESFVAPEVLAGQPFDQRSDVYSLGQLIAFLYSQGSMPFEYKQVVKKATAQNPDKRFKSIDEMRNALAQKRYVRRSVIAMVAAVAVSLLTFYTYVELLPSSDSVDFVEPIPQAEASDPFAEPYNPGIDLNDEGDSLDITDEMLNAKAEAIYRKRYEKAADEILSKVYNSKHMGSSEKTFMANSQSMAEELVKVQQQLAEETGMPSGLAGRIGHEIVEKLTEQKQKSLTRNGYIRAGQGDDDSEE